MMLDKRSLVLARVCLGLLLFFDMFIRFYPGCGLGNGYYISQFAEKFAPLLDVETPHKALVHVYWFHRLTRSTQMAWVLIMGLVNLSYIVSVLYPFRTFLALRYPLQARNQNVWNRVVFAVLSLFSNPTVSAILLWFMVITTSGRADVFNDASDKLHRNLLLFTIFVPHYSNENVPRMNVGWSGLTKALCGMIQSIGFALSCKKSCIEKRKSTTTREQNAMEDASDFDGSGRPRIGLPVGMSALNPAFIDACFVPVVSPATSTTSTESGNGLPVTVTVTESTARHNSENSRLFYGIFCGGGFLFLTQCLYIYICVARGRVGVDRWYAYDMATAVHDITGGSLGITPFGRMMHSLPYMTWLATILTNPVEFFGAIILFVTPQSFFLSDMKDWAKMKGRSGIVKYCTLALVGFLVFIRLFSLAGILGMQMTLLFVIRLPFFQINSFILMAPFISASMFNLMDDIMSRCTTELQSLVGLTKGKEMNNKNNSKTKTISGNGNVNGSVQLEFSQYLLQKCLEIDPSMKYIDALSVAKYPYSLDSFVSNLASNGVDAGVGVGVGVNADADVDADADVSVISSPGVSPKHIVRSIHVGVEATEDQDQDQQEQEQEQEPEQEQQSLLGRRFVSKSSSISTVDNNNNNSNSDLNNTSSRFVDENFKKIRAEKQDWIAKHVAQLRDSLPLLSSSSSSTGAVVVPVTMEGDQLLSYTTAHLICSVSMLNVPQLKMKMKMKLQSKSMSKDIDLSSSSSSSSSSSATPTSSTPSFWSFVGSKLQLARKYFSEGLVVFITLYSIYLVLMSGFKLFPMTAEEGAIGEFFRYSQVWGMFGSPPRSQQFFLQSGHYVVMEEDLRTAFDSISEHIKAIPSSSASSASKFDQFLLHSSKLSFEEWKAFLQTDNSFTPIDFFVSSHQNSFKTPSLWNDAVKKASITSTSSSTGESHPTSTDSGFGLRIFSENPFNTDNTSSSRHPKFFEEIRAKPKSKRFFPREVYYRIRDFVMDHRAALSRNRVTASSRNNQYSSSLTYGYIWRNSTSVFSGDISNSESLSPTWNPLVSTSTSTSSTSSYNAITQVESSGSPSVKLYEAAFAASPMYIGLPKEVDDAWVRDQIEASSDSYGSWRQERFYWVMMYKFQHKRADRLTRITQHHCQDWRRWLQDQPLETNLSFLYQLMGDKIQKSVRYRQFTYTVKDADYSQGYLQPATRQIRFEPQPVDDFITFCKH